jgi:hypothetical protein
MDFKQDITINDLDHTVFIQLLNNQTKEYRILVTGNGAQFVGNFIDDLKMYDRLCNSLRKNHSLNYQVQLSNDGSQLELKPTHALIDLNDQYILKRTQTNVSLEILFEDRLKKIEFDTEKIYPINDEKIGPCIILTLDHKMLPETVYEKLITCVNQNSKGYVQTNLIYLVSEYYDVKYLYQEELPVCTKNQILFNKILLFDKDKNVKCLEVQKGYTLLCKKFNNPLGGKIMRKGNQIDVKINNFNFDLASGCPGAKVKNYSTNPTYQDNRSYCSETDHFKYCYLFELPFKVDDGIYSTNRQILNEMIVLVQDNKVYPGISFLNNGVFEPGSYGSKREIHEFTIYL